MIEDIWNQHFHLSGLSVTNSKIFFFCFLLYYFSKYLPGCQGGALFLSFIAFYVTISSFFQISVFLRGGHQSPGCLSPFPPKMVLPKSFSPPKLKLLPRALPQYIQLHILQQPNFSDHASQSRYTQTSI